MDPASLPLRDIHPPAAPGWWPPAPLWWLTVAACLAATVAAVWLGTRAWRRWRRRRRAVRALECIGAAYADDPPRFAAEVSRLLRRAALALYPRTHVAGLHGEAWLAFLERHGSGFVHGPGRALATAPYRPGEPVDVEGLDAVARRWLGRNL